MPKAISYHCAIKYDDKVVIHGGLEWPKQPNLDTFILNLSSMKWTSVPTNIPCGVPPVFPINYTDPNDMPQPFYRTTCKLWDNHLIVATFDSIKNSSCTSALNLKTLNWHKIKDKRKPTLHGVLIT